MRIYPRELKSEEGCVGTVERGVNSDSWILKMHTPHGQYISYTGYSLKNDN